MDQPEIKIDTSIEDDLSEWVKIWFHADEGVIQLAHRTRFGDLTFISFPVPKADAVAEAISALARQATC